jgi:hypothetical protein
VTADDHTTYSLVRSTATSAITKTILSARTLDNDAGRTVDTTVANIQLFKFDEVRTCIIERKMEEMTCIIKGKGVRGNILENLI